MSGREVTVSVEPWVAMTRSKARRALAAHEPTGFFTDVVSGSVILDSMELLSDSLSIASQLCQTKYLRPLLHEKTHHATCDRPVGQALSALAASCANMPVEKISGQETPSLPIRDLAVLRAFYKLLEPLIEGLALFAEHDCVPRNSPVASSVSNAVMRLLLSDPRVPRALSKGGTIANPYDMLGMLFRVVRASDEWVDEKAFLLEQSTEERPYYLLGYVAVKGIYRSLVARSKRLDAPDLFLTLMLDYGFNDYRLAHMLLQPLQIAGEEKTEVPEEARLLAKIGDQIGDLANYFQDRFDDLYRNAESYAEMCDKHFTEREPFSVTVMLDWDAGRLDRKEPGYRNLDFQSQWRPILIGLRTASRSLQIFRWPQIFKYRHDFRFSSKAANITVDENGQATVLLEGATEPLRISAVPNAARGAYAGSVEGVLRGEGGSIAVVISGGDGLVAVKDVGSGAWNLPQLVAYFDDFPSTPSIVGSMTAIAEWQYLREDSRAEEITRFYAEQSHEAALYLYMQLAYRVPGETARRITANLNQEGLKPAFEADDWLKKVAFWSLQCGAGAWDIATYAQQLGISEQNILSEVSEANNRLKAVLENKDAFFIHGGHMVSTI